MNKTNIIITLHHEAVHCWPDCPHDDVGFLRHPHRHVFHITCKKAVSHNDRDIEIIMFKQKVKKFLDDHVGKDIGTTSCEQLAERLFNACELSYCKVMEDNENGAEVY